MNQKSFVIAAILAAAALSVIATPLAYAQLKKIATDTVNHYRSKRRTKEHRKR